MQAAGSIAGIALFDDGVTATTREKSKAQIFVRGEFMCKPFVEIKNN
jgi:hypothetical protein